MNDVDPTALEEITASMERIEGETMHGNIQFSCPPITYLDENLCWGGYVPGATLPRMFSNIISLYPWKRWNLIRRMQTELYITMYDSEEQGMEQVDAIAKLVNVCRLSGPTFVHCQAGLNRSSLIVARALWQTNQMAGPEIIQKLRELRSPAVLCNPTFESEVRVW